MPQATTAIADDPTLLAAWAGGDESALNALVGRHAALVRARCRRHLPSDAAEDAAQAVFLLLARKPLEAARAPCLEAWLLRVARHVVANARRESDRRARREQEVAAMQPATIADRDAPSADLDAALDRLPEHERSAIVLRFLRGCDDAETARILGVAEGTVRSRVSRGLGRLRALLARRRHALGIAAIAALIAQGRGQAAEPLALDAASAAALRLATMTARAMRRAAVVQAIAIALVPVAVVAVVVAIVAIGAQRSPEPGPRATAAAAAMRSASEPAKEPDALAPRSPEALRARLDPDADWLLGAHDVARAGARFAASPYAAFSATATGRTLVALAMAGLPPLRQIAGCGLRSMELDLSGRSIQGTVHWTFQDMVAKPIDLAALLGWFDGTILAVGADDGAPLAAAIAPRGADLPPGARWSTTVGGDVRITRDGALCCVTDRPLDADHLPIARGGAAPFVDRDADIELRHRDDDGDGFTLATRFAADGLLTVRRWSMRSDAEALSEPVDLARIAALPADAFAVCARRVGARTLPLEPPSWPEHPDTVGFTADPLHGGLEIRVSHEVPAVEDGTLSAGDAQARALLSDLRAVFERARGIGSIAVDGEVVGWLQPGSPLPSLSLRIDTPDADALIAALAAALAVPVDDAGGCHALLGGFVPIAAARIGRALVLTTHPAGVAGCLGGAGFGDDPAAAARLAEAAAGNAYAVVVVRDGALLRWLVERELVPSAAGADLAALCGERCDVISDRAIGDDRTCVGSGIVAGLLALLIDPGTGRPPWRGLTN